MSDMDNSRPAPIMLVMNETSAQEIINALNSFARYYGYVTIGDLYAAVGMESTYFDNSYGWPNTDGWSYEDSNGSIKLVIPDAIYLGGPH